MVSQLVARGLTSRQIAEAPLVTEGTAANYVERVLIKLNVHSRAQIAAWVVERGLSPAPRRADRLRAPPRARSPDDRPRMVYRNGADLHLCGRRPGRMLDPERSLHCARDVPYGDAASGRNRGVGAAEMLRQGRRHPITRARTDRGLHRPGWRRRSAFGLLALVAWLALPGPALAAERTFTVDSTDEGGDPVTGDGICAKAYLLVNNVPRPAGPCTLRAAIDEANATPDRDTIAFEIPGSGVQTIRPTSPLPVITRPIIIDGYSQPGARPNTQALGTDAVLLIELYGFHAGSGPGLDITAGGSTVKGLVINTFGVSASGAEGIRLRTNGENIIEGNFIGTNAAATEFLPNFSGVFIREGSRNNVIGGTASGARNLLSGNVDAGVTIFGAAAEGNRVEGNLIGTNAAGTGALSNNPAAQGYGVQILSQSRNNVIGGTASGAGNLLSGNKRAGVYIDQLAEGNRVEGNLIGTDAAGTAPLGNPTGVYIDNAQRNVIGGTAERAGNTIAFNTGAGVRVGTGTGNAIQGNAMFANGGLGIDLGNDGVTANDIGDGDLGPNNRQNFPALTSASARGGATAVAGTLDSTPNATFRLEFFDNPACDAPSGHGEGRTFLGSTTATTDGGGRAGFAASLPVAAAVGQVVTATATNTATGDTSEFSACRAVAAVGVTVSPTAGLATSEGGGRATFTVVLDSVPGADVTIGLSSSDPSEGAVAPASLTFTPANARTPQTVTVLGLDDALADGEVAYTIVTAPAQSADAAFNGLDAPDVTAVNRDDDPAPPPSPGPEPGPGPGPGPQPAPQPGPEPPSSVTPPLPTLTIADARRVEGNRSVANLLFTVRLSAASRLPVRVAYATQDLPARQSPRRALAGRDYVPRRDTLIIPPGRTVDTIRVPIRGDTLVEPDESFRLVLAGPSNATLGRAAALGTVLDDDGPPRLFIDDAERPEGQAGRANLAFTVGLTRPSRAPVTVSFATANGAARAPGDLVAVRGTLTFAPGVLRRTILVPVVGDRTREPDEQVRVVLSRAGVGLADPVGLGTILNDD